MREKAKFCKQILELQKYLQAGDSISLSLRKAGIHQRLHTDYLKNPDYKAMIEKYRQFNKSATSILIDKQNQYKKSLN